MSGFPLLMSVQQVAGPWRGGERHCRRVRERFRERFCLDVLSKVPLYAAGGRKPVLGRSDDVLLS